MVEGSGVVCLLRVRLTPRTTRRKDVFRSTPCLNKSRPDWESTVGRGWVSIGTYNQSNPPDSNTYTVEKVSRRKDYIFQYLSRRDRNGRLDYKRFRLSYSYSGSSLSVSGERRNVT